MKQHTLLVLLLIAGFHPLWADAGKNKNTKNPKPCITPVVTISNDTTICEGDSIDLTASGGGTYLWNTGQTTSTIKVSPLHSGNITYYVTVTVDSCSKDTAVIVDVVPSPYGCYFLPSTATICPGSGGVNLYLEGPNGPWSCTWSPPTGLNCTNCNNVTATPTASIIYTVVILDFATGCTKTVYVPVYVSDSLTARISGADSICNGSSVTLTASGGATYLWNTGDTANIINVTPSVTTTYWVKVASGSCFDSTAFTLKVDSCISSGINGIIQKKASVLLYPNPNKGEFTIQSSTVGGHPDSYRESVEIYNVLGEKVLTETLRTAQGDSPIAIGLINLTEQPVGLYLYRVITESGELIGDGKFIIQK